MFPDPSLCLGAGAVIHGDVVATTAGKVSCHGEAHDTETDEREFAHCSSDAGSLAKWARFADNYKVSARYFRFFP